MTVAELQRRQREWSERTFGPATPDRIQGVIKHIRKELDEIEAEPGDIMEHADLMILALELAWMCGHDGANVEWAVTHKQDINRARKWPSRDEQVAGEPVEHVREAGEG